MKKNNHIKNYFKGISEISKKIDQNKIDKLAKSLLKIKKHPNLLPVGVALPLGLVIIVAPINKLTFVI